jgi:hypothetical protein
MKDVSVRGTHEVRRRSEALITADHALPVLPEGSVHWHLPVRLTRTSYLYESPHISTSLYELLVRVAAH